MFKLIVVDDHAMFRESIGKMLSIKKVAEVIGEASNGEELLQLLDNCEPNLILMDIAMPGMGGVEATRKALAKRPDLKVLTLSSFGDEQHYFSMLNAGAKGFVLKNAALSELETAVKEVANGGSWFSSELLQKVIINISKKNKEEKSIELSSRELEVLKLICENLTNEQIGERIHISVDTVKWHRSNLLAKTGCKNAIGLLLYALKNNIISI
ncbi:MAG: response regulator transcription factor [Breznakibacter sp.]